ncbi:MAG: NYN domain-containing protein, partial [Anaerolineae bacterium]|nr:NYN domain-containing protein [Anaerolineae bacterium]
MPFLIDGHNLIPKVAGLRLGDVDVELALIGLLQRTGKKVEVYFDNAPPGYSGTRKYGNVTAVFVRAGGTADDGIRRRLSRLGRGAKNWTVVSSDREVQAEARGVGAKFVLSESFAADIKIKIPTQQDEINEDRRLSSDEVAEWLEI